MKLKRKLKKNIENLPFTQIFTPSQSKSALCFEILYSPDEIRIREEGARAWTEVLREREEESEEESEEPVINVDKSFKSDECVICLTNPPNVLFCYCGHLCLCVECEETKSLVNCPVCKTENTIKRTIEY